MTHAFRQTPSYVLSMAFAGSVATLLACDRGASPSQPTPMGVTLTAASTVVTTKATPLADLDIASPRWPPR